MFIILYFIDCEYSLKKRKNFMLTIFKLLIKTKIISIVIMMYISITSFSKCSIVYQYMRKIVASL